MQSLPKFGAFLCYWTDVIFLTLLLNCWPEVEGNIWDRKVGEKISAAADGISPCSGNLHQRPLE